MQGVSSDNLLAWAAQVCFIASLGAVLLVVFRIRHSKSRLFYCHAVLFASLILPALQPWQRVLLFSSNVDQTASPMAEGISWGTIILCIIATGIVARLAWLVMGLWQVRHFRARSLRLRPLPDSVRSARSLSGADAVFRLSRDVSSPATLGHIDPVILLPESFLSLNPEAQRSVAIHELLHVRRNDWLMTLIEEFTGSLFWFNPGAWWLLAQARLNREELVDGEVVRLTSEAAPYIQALLSIAGVAKSNSRKVALAAPFFTRKHLPRRMESLLTPPKASPVRLAFSYGLMTLVLIAGILSSFVWFPLVGQADVFVMASAVPGLPVPQFNRPANERFRNVRPTAFTVRVLPPPDVSLETAAMHEGPGRTIYFIQRPFHPTSFPPSLGGFGGPVGMPTPTLLALRSIRPGSVVEPEELQRLLASVPEGHLVTVEQDRSNIVTRVMITREMLKRRSPDDVHAIHFDIPSDPVESNEPAPATDGVN